MVCVGRAANNDLVITDDLSVSRNHVLLERVGNGWFVRDLNTTNGTDVNGERVMGERPLRHGDEIIVGRTRLVFHGRGVPDPSTDKKNPKPKLTVREREVLVELCRPILTTNAFKDAASTKEIAERLFIGDAAVKAHIGRLCDKFGVYSEPRQRRRELANRAIETGSVTRRDLESDKPDDR